MTRALMTGTSRRRALRGVAGGALAALLARFGEEETAAACAVHAKPCLGDGGCCSGFCKRTGTCKKNGKPTGKCRCRCPKGTTACGAKRCCGAGEECQGGQCVPAGGACTPACTGGQVCQANGSCSCPAGTENSCDSTVGGECHCCPVGEVHCGGGVCRECCIGSDCGCANPSSSCRFCGEGGVCRCSSIGAHEKPYCNGVCTTCCTDDDCADSRMSPGDGFICDTSRSPDANYCRCQNGIVEPCLSADREKYYCPDLQTDEENCGACGRRCLGWNCIAGVCTRPD